MKYRSWIFLSLIFCICLFTRFTNLNWGAPFYFHPDERNIASHVSELRFPTQLNPHFFAYGSLPIYSIYATGVIYNVFSTCHLSVIQCQVTFEQAIIISRIWSAVFSIGVTILLISISHKLYGEKVAGLVGLLAVFSTGLIQFSHFGTFEMWTTFFSVLLCYTLLFPPKQYFLSLLYSGIFVGILISIKVSNLVFLPLVLLVLCIPVLFKVTKKTFVKSALYIVISVLCITFCAFMIFIITNPFVLLDQTAFKNSMQYETSVALGTLPVFYTQEFMQTIPFIYQYIKVFPFLLSPLLGIVFPFFIIYAFYLLWEKKSFSLFIICSFFLFLLIPQAVLFVKWTRYMLPTLPFIYLLVGGVLFQFSKNRRVFIPLCMILVSVNILHSISYFSIAFLQPDTRVQASQKATTLLPADTPILSEMYDLGIVPFNEHFPKITLFNFYDVDTQPQLVEQFTQSRQANSAVILPSQRVLSTRISPMQFPVSSPFYQSLFNESLYKKLYSTPCQLLCQIVYLGDPIHRFEQTASVFDRPTIYIFQRL